LQCQCSRQQAQFCCRRKPAPISLSLKFAWARNLRALAAPSSPYLTGSN
jgi:hypothetical protein